MLPYSAINFDTIYQEMKAEKYDTKVMASNLQVPQPLIELILRMMSFSPQKRPKISEVLAHPALSLLDAASELRNSKTRTTGALLEDAYKG